MSNNKKQHYIPKFYLKRFSNEQLGKSIGIFNIRSKKYIHDGSLKNQAYVNNFYGEKENLLDNVLKTLENIASRCIVDIIAKKYLPSINSSSYKLLLIFTLLLRFRTLYAAEEEDELLDNMMKTIYSHDIRISPYLSSLQVKYKNPIHTALNISSLVYPLAFDLGIKLIENKLGCPLITSDNPVIFYNQFMEIMNITAFSGAGIASKGLQIFLPLDSNHILLFYDRDVYKVGSGRKEIATTNYIEDIKSLNALQILNCRENLFFNSRMNENEIRSLIRYHEMKRRRNKTKFKEYLIDKGNNDYSSSIIQFSRKDLRNNLNVSFVKIQKYVRNYEFGNSIFHVRNPEAVKRHEELVKKIKEGKATRSDYINFI